MDVEGGWWMWRKGFVKIVVVAIIHKKNVLERLRIKRSSLL